MTYQPRRALRAVGCMRLFGDRFGSTARLISANDSLGPAANSARECAMSSRNSGWRLNDNGIPPFPANGEDAERARLAAGHLIEHP